MIKYLLSIPAVADRKATIEIVESKDGPGSEFDMKEAGRELASIILRTLPAVTVEALQKYIEDAFEERDEIKARHRMRDT